MKTKRLSFILLFLLSSFFGVCAESGSFVVSGDLDKFYPVSFFDSQWHELTPTRMYISRHNVHMDELWRGAMSAQFDFHVSAWGNGGEFIRAEIQDNSSLASTFHEFVAGWQDVSVNNASNRIVVWLRGGGTSYNWVANGNVQPMVYDGVANPVPYIPDDNCVCDIKTSVEEYVHRANSSFLRNGVYPHLRIGEIGDAGNTDVLKDSICQRLSLDFTGYRDLYPDQVGARIEGVRYNHYENGAAYVQNTGLAFYTNPTGVNAGESDLLQRMIILPNGNVGIGTSVPDYELTVNGTIHAKEVVIDLQGALADDVFESDYELRSLKDVRDYIQCHGHLPGVPSASEVSTNGMSLGQFENLLLRKIEELTLYTLQLQAEIENLKRK